MIRLDREGVVRRWQVMHKKNKIIWKLDYIYVEFRHHPSNNLCLPLIFSNIKNSTRKSDCCHFRRIQLEKVVLAYPIRSKISLSSALSDFKSRIGYPQVKYRRPSPFVMGLQQCPTLQPNVISELRGLTEMYKWTK